MTTRLVHVTTVPMTLHFFGGQPAHMAAYGLETHVISSPGVDLDAFVRKEPTVVAHALPMSRSISPLHDMVALARMIRSLRRIKPHIVHTHTPKGGLLGTLGARLAGVPLIVHHVHGGVWLAATGVRRVLARLTDRVTCAVADRVLCVSRSVMKELVAEGLCPAWKVEVIACGSINGVDAACRFNPARFDAAARTRIREALGIPGDAVVIGYVGRLTGEKGIVELSQAWRSLRKLHPSARLLLVGPEDPVAPLPESVSTFLKSDDRIHMTGMDWETPPLYAAMDVFALPTYREGFPVAVLEASAMTLPVVATTVPGCTDAVVDGITGTLVPARDSDRLGDALSLYVADEPLRRRHGEGGRDRVLRDFRPEVIWEELRKIYISMDSRSRRSPYRGTT